LFTAEHLQAFTANNEYGSVLSIFPIITKHLHKSVYRSVLSIFSIFTQNLQKMVYSSKMNSSVAAASRLVVSVRRRQWLRQIVVMCRTVARKF